MNGTTATTRWTSQEEICTKRVGTFILLNVDCFLFITLLNVKQNQVTVHHDILKEVQGTKVKSLPAFKFDTNESQ